MQKKIDELSLRLGELLQKQQAMLSTAESCTGGLLAGAVTGIAGSSNWFDRGWITYSNSAKRAELGVSAEALKESGAVSEAVAREMVIGVLSQAPKATFALSTTGIAGPGGGTADKPVGLVWFGFARRSPEGVIVRAASRIFEGDRRAVREASVLFSLTTACEWLSQ